MLLNLIYKHATLCDTVGEKIISFNVDFQNCITVLTWLYTQGCHTILEVAGAGGGGGETSNMKLRIRVAQQKF